MWETTGRVSLRSCRSPGAAMPAESPQRHTGPAAAGTRHLPREQHGDSLGICATRSARAIRAPARPTTTTPLERRCDPVHRLPPHAQPAPHPPASPSGTGRGAGVSDCQSKATVAWPNPVCYVSYGRHWRYSARKWIGLPALLGIGPAVRIPGLPHRAATLPRNLLGLRLPGHCGDLHGDHRRDRRYRLQQFRTDDQGPGGRPDRHRYRVRDGLRLHRGPRSGRGH